MREKILELLRETDGFVSGQELSDRFGVSRTSIWKAIRQLEEMGYEIDAVRNRGYRLCREPDLLTKDLILKYLPEDDFVDSILVFDSIDSTNNEIKRRAEEGAPEGLLVIAQDQTAGRGRRGRAWDSAKNEGIFMSLLLRPEIEPGNASMLTLVMGLAVRSALEEICGLNARIKWPNDVICDGKKICGILTEMSAEPDCVNYIVIGVGINVDNTEFPKEVRSMATSVFKQTGEHFPRAKIIAACLRRFENYYAVFQKTQDLRELREEYNACLINCGREVRVLDSDRDDTGIARGIDERGELIVDTEQGARRVCTGEVSVRGIYGYT